MMDAWVGEDKTPPTPERWRVFETQFMEAYLVEVRVRPAYDNAGVLVSVTKDGRVATVHVSDVELAHARFPMSYAWDASKMAVNMVVPGHDY